MFSSIFFSYLSISIVQSSPTIVLLLLFIFSLFLLKEGGGSIFFFFMSSIARVFRFSDVGALPGCSSLFGVVQSFTFTPSKGFFSGLALNIKINGVPINLRPTRFFTLLVTLDYLKIKVPRFCYHESLSIAGNCRMCMVELKNSIKPVISCSTLLSSGMEVFTDSALVRDIRKAVLEFLLINHPLDCPICDQGGRCDLQDLSFFYGQDASRYKFAKRLVSNIFFNFHVKTVMVRCIHCTRCIRFLSEHLNVHSLGMMGRGNGSIISTYVSRNLFHSLVPNVIDLCPVGALTSRTSSSTYREWEKTSSSHSVDFLDPFMSPVSLEIIGNKIVDILPVTTGVYSFISDRTRSLWESLSSFRLVSPFVFTDYNNLVLFISSSSILSDLFFYYMNRPLIFCSSLFGFDFLDLGSSFLCSYLFSSFFNLASTDIGHFDHRSFVHSFSDFTHHLFVGLSVYHEAPLLCSIFNLNKEKYSIYSIGGGDLGFFLNKKLRNVGAGHCSLRRFFEGRSILSVYRSSSLNVFVNSLLFSLFSMFSKSFFSISFVRGFGKIHKEEVGFNFSFNCVSRFLKRKTFFLFKFHFGISLFTNRVNTLFNFSTHPTESNGISSVSYECGVPSLFEKAGRYISVKGVLNFISRKIRDSATEYSTVFIPLVRYFLQSSVRRFFNLFSYETLVSEFSSSFSNICCSYFSISPNMLQSYFCGNDFFFFGFFSVEWCVDYAILWLFGNIAYSFLQPYLPSWMTFPWLRFVYERAVSVRCSYFFPFLFCRGFRSGNGVVSSLECDVFSGWSNSLLSADSQVPVPCSFFNSLY